MTTSFTQKEKAKRQFILTVVLLMSIVLAIVFWERPFEELPVPAVFLPERADIDFNALEAIFKKPIFERLIPFEQIAPFKEEEIILIENEAILNDEVIVPAKIGRENPFTPF
ncbi:MAG: hypothetical protein LRZ96_00730 [Candidatus Pacebacteria bacterium]|nr:hypothetical protein [Candidatus Paceibacterota bacterium]